MLAAVSAAADWLFSTVVYKHTSHVTKADGREVFLPIPKNESTFAGANRFVEDRFWKSGAIQERC